MEKPQSIGCVKRYPACMSLYLSHISALDYWRSLSPDAERVPCARVKAVSSPGIGFDPIEVLRGFAGSDLREYRRPIHILVPDKGARIRSKHITSHLWRGAVPPNSFVRASKDAYVASPELCFLQEADTDLRKLICLGYELCGSYAVRRLSGQGFVNRKPLSNTLKMNAYAASAQGVRGIGTARRALRFVLDGAASPMETIVAVLLCLPCSLGGYGIPRPVLNYRIEPGEAMARMVEKSSYACDLCWPEARVAVEYDSDSYHTGSSRIGRDSKRRNALLSLDFEVRTLTRAQVFEYYAFDRFARQLAKRLGHRLRESIADCDVRRRELRALLFGMMGDPL